jgi:bis(5'-nucleosyl)-tetraphosphatase (symmetrical)
MSSPEHAPRRRIFVGDIQGCRAELEELLERVRFDPLRDVLHPVGDFVNRGPDSAGVLRVCRALGAGGVLGNHDVHALRVAGGLRAKGKRDTLDALLAADDRDELLAWLAARPFVLGFEDVVCVHAALDPSWKDPLRELALLDPLREEPVLAFAISARYCDEHGRRPRADWPPPPPPFRPWYEFWPRAGETRTVVFGHWARNGLVVRPKVRGLDTGCVWGGKLTAWIADEDRIVQVDARASYAEYD